MLLGAAVPTALAGVAHAIPQPFAFLGRQPAPAFAELVATLLVELLVAPEVFADTLLLLRWQKP